MKIKIKVENLTKTYAKILAVSNLSFTVSEGEIYGLLGSNGAGKTTSIECILGTKKADSGTVRILDMDPLKNRKQLFEHVGVQFQENCFQDKITVSELCEETECLYAAPADYHHLLSQFGLAEKKKSPVSELSGGQKQRLFIVLSLIPNPEVVFLDELTTGLDTKARRDIWKHLIKLKSDGLAILLTSHFMDEVEALCDHITILKQGKSVFRGTVKEAIEASPYENLEDAYLWYTGEEESYEAI